MNSSLILTKTEKNCRTFFLNRPENLNTFNFDLAEAFVEAMKGAAQDESIRCVVLRGSGKAFSAGGDLKMIHGDLANSAATFRRISLALNTAIDHITTMPKPVVAAVTGPAFAAGFGVALACDVLVASETATFSPSFTNIALSPNAATTYFLPRILGPKKAAEAFFLGDVWTAAEAKNLGLVNQVWPEDEFETQLISYQEKLVSRPTSALSRIKNLLRETYSQDFLSQIAQEKEQIALSSECRDFKEGIQAFIDKRGAKFSGK